MILATRVCTFISKLLEIEPHTCTSETFISETCIFRRATLQKSFRYLNTVEFKYAVSMLCLIQLITGCWQVSGGLLPTLFMCCYHFSCARYSNPFVTYFVDSVKNCVGFSQAVLQLSASKLQKCMMRFKTKEVVEKHGMIEWQTIQTLTS